METKVCEKNPPQKVVKQLYELYPESLEIRNSGDDLPLHVLCRSCPDQNESIKYLANCFPKALEMKGSEGCLPLHLLCQKGADVKVVEEIYVHFPMASRSRDEFGLLPLHWACLKNSPLEIIEFLIRTCPPALEWQDNWGRIPRDIYEKQHLQMRSCDDEEDKKKLSLLSLDQQHTPESFWTLDPLYQIKDLKEELLQTQQELEQCSTDRDRFVEENSILKKRLENVEIEKSKQEESWEKELDFVQWDKEQTIAEYETQSQILQKELEKIQDSKHEMEQDVKELRKSDSIKDQAIQNLKKQNDVLRIQLKTFSHYLTDTLVGNIQSANEVLDVSFKEESRNEHPTRNFTDKKKIKRRAPQRVFQSTVQPKMENSRQIICLDQRDKVYF